MSTTEAPALPRATKPAPAPAPQPEPDESVYVDDPRAAPIDWTAPSPAAEQVVADIKATTRSPKTRGLPMGPTVIAAGNGTLLAVTTAYQAGGWAGMAGVGVLATGGTMAAVARRRATVRRNAAIRLGSDHRAGGTRRQANSSGGWGGQTRSRGTGAHWSPSTGHRLAGPAAVPSGTRSTGSLGPLGTRGQANTTRTPSNAKTSQGRRGETPSTSRSGVTGRLARIADRLLGGTGRANRDSASRSSDKTAKPSRGKALTRRALGLTRRGVAAAWTKSRPHRSRAWAAARRGLSKTRKAAWDGLLAAFAGALSALWHWSRTRGGQRMREVWRKRRDRRAEQAAEAQSADSTEQADVADAITRPTTPTPTSSQGDRMSGHHFTAAAMEMARAASAYDPQGMLQVGRDFAGLQEALQLVAESMRISTDNADAKQPLDPRIIELMRGIHQLQLKAAEMAGELVPAFRNLHHVDLERLENPRKGVAGEAMWDVRANF